MRRNRFVYTLLSLGLIGGFLGHGMFAVESKASFAQLITGSFDNVFGITVATSTATSWVRAIGWFDIAVTLILVAMLIGNIAGKGKLYQLAYSKAALVIFAWGALWGFATAASRVTAAGDFYPAIWDLVERAPNFMLPAALFYLVYQHRLDHSPTSQTLQHIEQRTPTAAR